MQLSPTIHSPLNSDSGPSADYPRAIIYDFVCIPPEESSHELITSLVEFPAYTYVGKYIIPV